MAETTGIENLKTVVDLLTGIINKADKQFADGVQPMDFFAFIGDFSQLPAVIKEKEAIKEEVAALTDETRSALSDYFAKQLSLTNARAESITEHAVALVMSGWALFEELKSGKTDTTAEVTA